MWGSTSRYARDLVTRLLKPKCKRLTAEEALKAPWFLQRDATRLTGPIISSTNLHIPFKYEDEEEEEEEIENFLLSPIVMRQNTISHRRSE